MGLAAFFLAGRARAAGPFFGLRPFIRFSNDLFTADAFLATRASNVSSSDSDSDSEPSSEDSEDDDSDESSSSRRLFATGLDLGFAFPFAFAFAEDLGFGPGFAFAAGFFGDLGSAALVGVFANGSFRLASSLSQNALGALRSRVLLPPLRPPPVDPGVSASDLVAVTAGAAGVVASFAALLADTLAMRCAAMSNCCASREPRLAPPEPLEPLVVLPARTALILFPSSSESLSPMRCDFRAAGDFFFFPLGDRSPGDPPPPTSLADARFSAACASFSSGDLSPPPGDT